MPSIERIADPYRPSDHESRTQTLLQRAALEVNPAEGDRLRTMVVLENRPLARSLAQRFYYRGIEHDDLLQVSFMGLVQAVNRYRPDAGAGFTAFAVPTITGELRRHFRDHGWAVRPPRALQELHRNVRWARAELLQKLQREPTSDEIADLLHVAAQEVDRARQLDLQYTSVSLDRDRSGRGDEPPLGELLPDETDAYDGVDNTLTLRLLLQDLTEHDRLLIRLRFVDRLTQREIGTRLSVSQMQVSRLLRDLLARLRDRLSDLTLTEAVRHA